MNYKAAGYLNIDISAHGIIYLVGSGIVFWLRRLDGATFLKIIFPLWELFAFFEQEDKMALRWRALPVFSGLISYFLLHEITFEQFMDNDD